MSRARGLCTVKGRYRRLGLFAGWYGPVLCNLPKDHDGFHVYHTSPLLTVDPIDYCRWPGPPGNCDHPDASWLQSPVTP